MEEKLPRDQSLPSLGWEPQAYIPCFHCQCKMWWVFFGLDIGGSKVKNLPAMQEVQELQVRSLGLEDPMEEGMATHSRILAWRISWTEEPGRFPVHGVVRVRHDLATERQPDLLFWHPDLRCVAFRILRNKHQLPRNHPSLHYFLQQPKPQSLHHSKNMYFRMCDEGRLSPIQKDMLPTILHPRQINNNQSPLKPWLKLNTPLALIYHGFQDDPICGLD